MTEPQEKFTSSNTTTTSAFSSKKGQEIARLAEKRPLVKSSLSENAWNYEIRQFNPETSCVSNTNPVADNSTKTVAMKQQSATYSVHSYNKVPDSYFNWKIPDNSLVTSYGTTTSVSSQVTPEYAITHQYPIYRQPSVITVSNTVASDHLVPVEMTMNYKSAAACMHTNGTDLINANSAHTPHSVYPVNPQVYQPLQNPETPQAYFAYCSYNQAAENTNSTPALEHGVYPLTSRSQKKE